MLPRERVLTAVAHAEPDRVPTAIWGSAYGITDPLYLGLLRHLGLGEAVAPFRRRRAHTVNYYDDRVLEALQIDVRHVWSGFPDLGGPGADGGVDVWGITWVKRGIYPSPDTHPLARATLADLDQFAWPQVEPYLRLDELEQRARWLHEQTAYAVVARAPDSYGPFERCCALRGTEQFMIDLGAEPEFAEELIRRVTDVICRLLELYLETAGRYLDILELPGDDYAALRPIISPRMFDRFFAPAYRRIIGTARQIAPHCKILFHSDGNMEPFLGRLIDLGVDIFHCLEPLPGVDLAAIKAKYGDRLCFWGAIDIKEALQGDEARVIAEVRQRIAELASGGGYVLAPANHLQPDIVPQNVVALFKAARDYGTYPLAR